MEVRFAISPTEAKQFTTEQLRENFLVSPLMVNDTVQLIYTHYDRMIVGGAKPVSQAVTLPNHPELKAGYFLERRELGIINVGAAGKVTADGQAFEMEKQDCLYLGKGIKDVVFESVDVKNPAVFYLLSSPAHAQYPNTKYTKEQAAPVSLGAVETSNKRTVYKYIHEKGIQSCQLVMGLTVLDTGSVWNSVPPHTHTRRMEVYFYFDVPEEQRIFHFMGEPQQTRHLVLNNYDAVVSPPWSTHFGCGTSNYGFIWGMAGENLDYDDMDKCAVSDLK